MDHFKIPTLVFTKAQSVAIEFDKWMKAVSNFKVITRPLHENRGDLMSIRI